VKGSRVSSDELKSYNGIAAAGYIHGSVNHSAKQFVSGEDGIRCSGEGSGTFRANFKVLSDLANTGLDFEFSFGTLGTPYGITVRNEKNCFRMICENTIQDETRLQQDLRKTLLGLVSMKPISIEQFETPLLEERK